MRRLDPPREAVDPHPVPVDPDHPFDDVLVAARAGAGWAFRRLWDDLSPAVAGYLRSRGAPEPEDLTSEVFLAAFTGIGRFVGGEAAFRSYVFTIAHHRLVDDLRRRARRDEVPWEEHEDGRRVPSAEDDAMAAIGTDLVRSLLAGLSPDQRDVLALRVLADLTVEQVAQVLGKQPGAVKALQRRGLEALRRRTGAQGVPLEAAGTMTGSR